MRILFLCDWFLPHAGGARVYYYNLYRHLAGSGNEVTILTKKVPGWKDFDHGENRLPFRIIRWGNPLYSWKCHQLPKIVVPMVRLGALLASHTFDLVHFGDLYPQGVLSLWLKRTLGKPYLAYCHGEEITQTDRRRYQPRVRDAIFREAEVVVAANEFARQNLLRIGISADRIRKITPGVDCLHFQPEGPSPDLIERHGLRGKKVLLTVARLVPRKGHKAVLEALRRLLPEIPDLTYLIVGTGPEEESLKKLVAEWNLHRAVRFVGFVPDNDLPAYYNTCDLFLMMNSEDHDSGDVEGFGMVFLEANACGKPVIAGRSGGTTEAVVDGGTGFLVDPQNAGELTNALRALLRDGDLRAKLGQAGLQRARTEFSWPSRARMLDRINQEIARAAPRLG